MPFVYESWHLPYYHWLSFSNGFSGSWVIPYESYDMTHMICTHIYGNEKISNPNIIVSKRFQSDFNPSVNLNRNVGNYILFVKNFSSLFMVFAFCFKFKMLFTLGWELFCCGACKLLKPRVFVKSGEEVNFLRYSKLCIFRWLSLFEILDLTVSRVLDSYRLSGRGRTQYPSIFAHRVTTDKNLDRRFKS